MTEHTKTLIEWAGMLLFVVVFWTAVVVVCIY